MGIPVLTFTAYSNTGKTTYLEKLIPCLKSAGLRIAVIKHDAHDFQADIEGKDSWAFRPGRCRHCGSCIQAAVRPFSVFFLRFVCHHYANPQC